MAPSIPDGCGREVRSGAAARNLLARRPVAVGQRWIGSTPGPSGSANRVPRPLAENEQT